MTKRVRVVHQTVEHRAAQRIARANRMGKRGTGSSIDDLRAELSFVKMERDSVYESGRILLRRLEVCNAEIDALKAERLH